MKLNRLAAALASFGVAVLNGNAGQFSLVSIPINNASFESPGGSVTFGGIPGWAASGTLVGVGTFRPSDFPFGGFAAADGTHVGYIDAWGRPTALWQTLSATLEPNTIYSLSIEIAGAESWGGIYNPGADFSVSILAGTSVLASVTPAAPPPGGWETLTATTAPTGEIVSPNQYLTILISTSATELDFDNVKLTSIDPPPNDPLADDPPNAPDAGCVSWLAGLALMGFARFARLRK